jgi:hypothetical protein
MKVNSPFQWVKVIRNANFMTKGSPQVKIGIVDLVCPEYFVPGNVLDRKVTFIE